MKIIIVVSNLNKGGMQKSLISFANELSERHDLTICLFERQNELISYLDEKINVIYQTSRLEKYIMLMQTHKNILKQKNLLFYILKGFIRFLEKIGLSSWIYKVMLSKSEDIYGYDVAISYTGRPGIWDEYVIKKISSDYKMVWIHNDPLRLGITSKNSYALYNRFDVIFNVSKYCKNTFDKIAPTLKNKSHLFYNIMDIESVRDLAKKYNPYSENLQDKIKFVTVARLDNSQKRIDRIISVSTLLVSKDIRNFIWYIVGDGPDYDYLNNLIKTNELQDFIILVGFEKNPYPYIENSDLFILTSDYEGLPVTIMEAHINNIPVLATNFNCATEAIQHGFNGVIVEKDSLELFDALSSVLENPYQLNQMKANLIKCEFKNKNSILDFEKIVESLNYEN